MGATRAGGLKAAKTIKLRHGEDFYRIIGAEGGRNSTKGGFHASKASGLNWHIEAGRKGGLKSKRGKKK